MQGTLYSEKLNLRTANEREDSVEEALRRLIGVNAGRIVVTQRKPWQSIAEMEEAREFNDRPMGIAHVGIAQDLLTRSAHIKVIDPGLCSVHTGLQRRAKKS